MLKSSGISEKQFIFDLQMHFVLSWSAYAGNVIDSLLYVKKKNFINRRFLAPGGTKPSYVSKSGPIV